MTRTRHPRHLTAAWFAAAVVVLLAGPVRAVDLHLERRLPGGDGGVTALAFGPDGELVWGSSRGELRLAAPGGEAAVIAAAPKDRAITAVALSPDGRTCAFAAKGQGVFLLGPRGGGAAFADGAPRALQGAKGRIDVLAFSSDGRRLAAGGDDEKVWVWELPVGDLRGRLDGKDGDILAIDFHDGDGTVATVGADRRLVIWSAASLEALRRFELDPATVPGAGIDLTAARFSADGLMVAVAFDEHYLEKGGRSMRFEHRLAYYDVAKGVLLKTTGDYNAKLEGFALYPQNCFVAFDNSTLRSGALAFCDIASGDLPLSYPLPSPCSHLIFSRDGGLLAGVADAADGSGPAVHLWSVDYDVPASGCFGSRLRLTSAGGPVIGPGAAAADGRPVVAILPFAVGGAGADAALGGAAAHFLESRLSDSPRVRLVERARLDDVVGELKLQQGELVDPATAVKMGKLLGVALIVTGNVDRIGTDLVVSARVIAVAGGEILGTKEVHCAQCGADDLFDAVDLLAGALVAD